MYDVLLSLISHHSSFPNVSALKYFILFIIFSFMHLHDPVQLAFEHQLDKMFINVISHDIVPSTWWSELCENVTAKK